MKSLVNDLVQVATGILKDVRLAYPAYGKVVLDLERLTRLSKDRGLGLFSLDLPNLDAILLDGLEEGRLVLVGPLSRAYSKKIKVPKLFSGLWLRVFNIEGILLPEPDTTAIFMLRQLCCLGKKISGACSSSRLNDALDEYVSIEHQLRPPSLCWDKDVFDPDNRLGQLHLLESDLVGLPLFPLNRSSENGRLSRSLAKIQRVADILCKRWKFCEPVTYSGDRHERGLPSGFRHGPGAVAERCGNVNKYDFPHWPAKLEAWFPYSSCGTFAGDVGVKPRNHEPSSRLIAVDKTAKSPRLIAAEPTSHQWCQQLLLRFMVDQFQSSYVGDFIDLTDQSLSGDMARVASRDRRFATVDLSSASDRLSCYVVERILRSAPSLLHAIHASRTRSLRITTPGKETTLLLKKFASQGTAVTFPVQSFVFLCIALGVSIDGNVTEHKIKSLIGQVRVFGDDIILPNAGYADLVGVLHHLQLRVNTSKSYSKGFFRESCGADAYRGDDVTPCKPQRLGSYSPSSREATISVSNNFFQKGLWYAAEASARLLDKVVTDNLVIQRPGDGVIGLLSFSGSRSDHLRKRWDPALHQWKYRMWRASARNNRQQPGERYALMQFFTELPRQDLPWSHGYSVRAQSRDRLRWEPLH